MKDPFKNMLPGLTRPAFSFFEVVPSDDEPLATRPRAIRVGVDGDVCAVGVDGVVVTFRNCVAGEVLDIRPLQIKKTGTTASNLVAYV
ncbi:hypothetical protein LMA00_07955 [Burkholderia ambifaria]|uniref:spike base protein, RCAP_Rcc01079 family n=1 Tax=Burkholderia ambifaria TaxID=152480 RepID=UPI001E2D2623|nr:hypothetical protein [Burkholderia ambifaria]UEP49670.1 hypothetical protein LMA00_07955 [Burkholderia ambifaria]